MVASGLVMESDCQLNHTLDVQTEMPTRGPVARQGAPDVFESFMSVEKMGAIEEVEASLEVLVVGRHGHNEQAPSDCVTLSDNLHVFIG
jgi:hypothetical protein